MTGKRGRGRPRYSPTDEERLKVRVMRMDGQSKEMIATVLGINDRTLEKHFQQELDEGAATLRSEIMTKLASEALDGKVAAARQLEVMTKSGQAKQAEREFTQPTAPQKPLGKKEQAHVEAKTAGVDSEWGDDLHPTVPASNAVN